MRILVVNTLYHPFFQGGAEKSVQLLCEGFRDAGHEVEVVCMGTEDRVGLVNGIKVHYLRTRNVKGFMKVRGSSGPLRMLWHLVDVYNPFYFFFFRRLFSHTRPDVLFSNNLPGWSVSVWSLAKRYGVPVVHTLRDHALMCPRGTMFHKGKRCAQQCLTWRLFSFPKKRLSTHVDAVVGISSFILNRHLAHGYFSQSASRSVIPNSVQATFDVVDDPRALKENGLVFGYLGRISAEKGAGYLVDEFVSLPSSLNARLLIGGDGDPAYVEELKKRSTGFLVDFLGRVQVGDFFAGIDVLIVPSLLEESFGRVVIEAWSAGVYVLGAVSGGLSELASCGNMTLFKPGNGQLKLLLEKVHRDGVSFEGKQFMAVKDRFDRDRVASDYLELFNALQP